MIASIRSAFSSRSGDLRRIAPALVCLGALGFTTGAQAADFQYFVPAKVKHAGSEVEVYLPQVFRAHDGLAGKALADAALAETGKLFADATAFDVKVKGPSASITVKDAKRVSDPALTDRAAGAVYHTLRAAGVTNVTLQGKAIDANHFSRGVSLIIMPFTSVMPPNRLNYGLIRYGNMVATAETFYKLLNEGDVDVKKAAAKLLGEGSPAIKIALLEKVRMFKFRDLSVYVTPRLTDPNLAVRLKALAAVKGTKNKDILKVLGDIVAKDPSADAKVAAVRILVDAGENRYKRYLLLEKLKDKKPGVVIKAAKGLIEANDEKFGTAFPQLTLHPDARVREAGLKGLLHYKQYGPMVATLENPALDAGIAERMAKAAAGMATGPDQAKAIGWLVTKGTKLGALHGAKLAQDKRVAGTTPALSAALKRPEPRVRLAAASALSALRDPAALEPLAEAIRKVKDIKEREAMELFAIKIVEAQSLDQAIKISKSTDATVRQLAIKSLASKVDKHKNKVVSTLKMRMKDRDVNIRRAAAYALARVKDDKVVGDLVEMLDDGDAGVRAEIAYAVANSSHPKANKILIKMIDDRDKLVKRAAVKGLRTRKVTEALPKLKMLSKVRYPAVRFEVWAAIASMSTKGNTDDFDMWSTDALYDKSPDIRVLAIEMLSSYVSDQRTASTIGGALIDTSAKVKLAALKALANLKHPQAGQEAARALFDDDKEVKLVALETLEKLKQASVKGRLKEFIKKEKDAELVTRGKAILAAL